MKMRVCFLMNSYVLSMAFTIVSPVMTMADPAYPAPEMAQCPVKKVAKVVNITFNTAGQNLWISRRFDGMSNRLAGLDSTIRQEFANIRGELGTVDENYIDLFTCLDREWMENSARYSNLVDQFAQTRSASAVVADELHLMSATMTNITREFDETGTELANGISRLARTMAFLILGFALLAFILVSRNLTANPLIRPGIGIVPATVLPLPTDVTTIKVRQPEPEKSANNVTTNDESLPVWGEIPDPGTVFQRLKHLADEAGGIPPIIPDEYCAAVATTKGHIRSDNQDYCLCLQLGNVTALLIADGCGGAAHGAYASYVAVRAAATFLVNAKCGTAQSDIVPLARQTLLYASDAMEKCAAAAMPPVRDGFRTTLIIILADSKRYAFAYAGDGGGVIVRKNASVEMFLFPQKADIDNPNVLATSLGPMLEGEPASGAIPRYPGDVLITGTDGIWDYVKNPFPRAVAKTLVNAGGNTRIAARTVIDQLADISDEYGYICSDNLTIGLITTPGQTAAPLHISINGSDLPLNNTSNPKEVTNDYA
ncbi:MAG: protein phosphatase 2C domain-containing protein [bacterium]